MNFICRPCRGAADLPPEKTDMKKKFHKACQGGTWCECQHRVREAQ